MSTTISSTADIDAAPGEVWRVLTDFPEYPTWNPFMDRIEGDAAVGARLVVHMTAGKRGTTFKPVVLRADPGREFRWLGKLGPGGLFDGEHFFVLEPTGAGGTRLTHGERFSGLLVRLLPGTMKDTHAGFDAFKAALKQRVEAQVRP